MDGPNRNMCGARNIPVQRSEMHEMINQSSIYGRKWNEFYIHMVMLVYYVRLQYIIWHIMQFWSETVELREVACDNHDNEIAFDASIRLNFISEAIIVYGVRFRHSVVGKKNFQLDMVSFGTHRHRNLQINFAN